MAEQTVKRERVCPKCGGQSYEEFVDSPGRRNWEAVMGMGRAPYCEACCKAIVAKNARKAAWDGIDTAKEGT